MVEATASLEGELIAAETGLQGLRQIYTDNNVRVRSTQARIEELRSQLRKLGGNPGTADNAEAQDAEDTGFYLPLNSAVASFGCGLCGSPQNCEGSRDGV